MGGKLRLFVFYWYDVIVHFFFLLSSIIMQCYYNIIVQHYCYVKESVYVSLY